MPAYNYKTEVLTPSVGRLICTLLACTASLALAHPSIAATRWAGLTPAQVIPAAARDAVGLGVAFGQIPAAKAAFAVRQLEHTKPIYLHRVTCRNHAEAWAVRWPKSDPVYLNAKKILLACR